ncbi:MAG: acyl-CoA dehydrogenase family protein, partial [Deltaproteobacteria bacterium]|nr:acyl-CoA dehydrogenase family protein [Deltaproteobacteria bacterium]
MNFDLSEEQELLQDTVKQYIQNECPMSRLRELFDDESGWDPVLWKGLAELGVAGLHLPEEHGGAGLEILDLALVNETLGETAAPVPFFSHALAGAAIDIAGSDEQKAKYLPRLASGEALGTIAFAEDGSLWNPDQWQLGDGGKLTGAKELVPFASQADLFVIGLAGGGLAVVEKDAAGLTVSDVDGV